MKLRHLSCIALADGARALTTGSFPAPRRRDNACRHRCGFCGGVNPRDRVAGFRVLQLMPGIGPTTAGRILDAVDTSTDAAWALSEVPPPAKAGQHWSALVALIARLSGREIGWPLELSHARHWYEPLMEDRCEDAAARTADIVQLEQIASGYPSREKFPTELTLDPPDATSDQAGVLMRDEDYLSSRPSTRPKVRSGSRFTS